MNLQRWILPPVIALTFSCTSTTRLRNAEPVFNPADVLTMYTGFGQVRGFGKISASSEGENFFGTFEVQCREDRSCKMVFYSPLGTAAGSIISRNDSAVLRFGDSEQTLAFADTFTHSPLPWGNLLCLGEVVQVLCGRVIFIDSLHSTKPEEIISSGFRNTYIWKIGQWTLSAVFSGRANRLRQIALEQKIDGTTVFSIHFTSFSKGGARFISMKADDRNYFSITYEQLRYTE